MIRLLFGPALYRVYRTNERVEIYSPYTLERYGNTILFCLSQAYGIGVTLFPAWLSYQVLTKRTELFHHTTITSNTKLLTIVGISFALGYFLRFIGRLGNPVYKEFIQVYENVSKNPSVANKEALRMYDAEFWAYPVDFVMKSSAVKKFIDPDANRSGFSSLLRAPSSAIGWIMTRTFGLALIYPGSLKIVQSALREHLDEGRQKLILELSGRRYKIQTADNNTIDTMFVDRRKNSSINSNGTYLVISAEGNAGFYEIGVMSSPLEAGFSVLGWNHPGFGGSTGSPVPSEEVNAIDAVMQFAIEVLKFEPDHIVLHGWSIGGFAVSWAAMNYPNVKAVILDATFDTILPLAIGRMPQSLESLVTVAIEDHVNLNVLGQLKKYPGPLRLIRRTNDEIIAIIPGDRRTNRGNFLLKGILKHRYPDLIHEHEERFLDNFFIYDQTGQNLILATYQVEEGPLTQMILSHEESHPDEGYPSTLGKQLNQDQRERLTLFLASRYMTEFDSQHCNPLPARLFTLPWDPREERLQ